MCKILWNRPEQWDLRLPSPYVMAHVCYKLRRDLQRRCFFSLVLTLVLLFITVDHRFSTVSLSVSPKSRLEFSEYNQSVCNWICKHIFIKIFLSGIKQVFIIVQEVIRGQQVLRITSKKYTDKEKLDFRAGEN